MCFSAEASFTVGGLLLAIGLANLAQVVLARSLPWSQRLPMLPFVLVPVAFGAQQISEGFVWLDRLANQNAIRCFTFFAYPFWPGFIPFTMALLEWRRPTPLSNAPLSVIADVAIGERRERARHPPNDILTWSKTRAASFRRYIIVTLALIGELLFAYLLIAIIQSDPIHVDLQQMRIVYEFDFPHLFWVTDHVPAQLAAIFYVAVIVGSLFLSSIRHTKKIAIAIAASLFVSVKIWMEAFASTWCFFSACISSMVLIVTRVELQYRQECLKSKKAPEPIMP